MHFLGRATDLVKDIEKHIEECGPDLVVAFHIDPTTLKEAQDSMIGGVQVSKAVERDNPPRLDLVFFENFDHRSLLKES